jgi:hypothetical protein
MTPEPIQPNAVYSSSQAAKLIGIDRHYLPVLRQTGLKAKLVGKAFRYLGQSILEFMEQSEVKNAN